MCNSRQTVLTWCLLLLLPAAVFGSDELHMADGSRLVGRLVSLQGEKVTFATSFAGELTIAVSSIAGITSDQPMIVTLASGDRVSGRLMYDAQAGQSVAQTTFGDVPLVLTQIAAIWRAGDDAVDGVDAEQAQRIAALRQLHEEELELERQRSQALQEAVEKAKAEWSARLEAGLSGQTGNSERIGFHGRAEAKRTAEMDRLLIYIEGRYSEQNSARSENEIFGGMDLEVDLDDRWFLFGKMYLEYDEFENLDLRARVTAGLGHFLIREEDQELKLRAGVGFQHESFNDGTSNNDGIMELGYDYMLEVTPWLLFRHGLTWYPTFDDPMRNYRLVAETSGEIPLGASEWKIRTGVRNQYNAQPVGNIEKLDTFYFLNLVMDWK